MYCSACETDNEAGRKFCGECGNALAAVCPACGSANTPGVKFCGECGAQLGVEAAAPSLPSPAEPVAERRLVSVLFADLVGFTSASEARDAEDMRELLSRYFDTCRRLIELYGGTVEKFIGDAVMAVWGTPTATEDDAERAVRAALDLVAAVTALGDEGGVSELRARAAVMTGEAAVTIGAEGQGMVAGDLVNTASRVQSLADPGSVLVGEATRRATDADGRLRGGGLTRAEGEDRAHAALASAADRVRCARLAEVGRARGAVRRPRPRAPADQGALPRLRGRGQGAPRLGHRHRRDRQVAAGLGVLQVLRRDRTDHVLAPRTLPLLRRGCDVLGSCRHGPHARADRGGRGRGFGPRQVGGGRRGAPRRSGRAPLRRAQARASPRTRGRGRAVRARRPVRGVAAVLRAARRRLPRSHALRGHAVGGCFAPRLHRAPARVGTQLADPRRHAGAARAARTAANLGSRPPELQFDLPGAASRARDGAVAHRPRPRPPGGAARADPRQGGGHPAVRGRNRAHAARPGRARAGGRRLSAGRNDRVARGPGDAPRIDRRPAGRTRRRPSAASSRTPPSSARRSRSSRSPR